MHAPGVHIIMHGADGARDNNPRKQVAARMPCKASTQTCRMLAVGQSLNSDDQAGDTNTSQGFVDRLPKLHAFLSYVTHAIIGSSNRAAGGKLIMNARGLCFCPFADNGLCPLRLV